MPYEPPVGNGRTILLRSGGTIRLIGNFDPFKLQAEERELVFKILDMLTEYEDKQKVEACNVTEA